MTMKVTQAIDATMGEVSVHSRYLKDVEVEVPTGNGQYIAAALCHINGDDSWPWGGSPVKPEALTYLERLIHAGSMIQCEINRVIEGGEEVPTGQRPEFRSLFHLSQITIHTPGPNGAMTHIIHNPKTAASKDGWKTMEIRDGKGVTHRLLGQVGGAVLVEQPK